MSRIQRAFALSLAVSVLLAVSACTPRVPPTPVPAPAPKASQPAVDPARPVTVALLSPMSADKPGLAQLGKALANAARLAAGRRGDPLLQLRIYDTAGDPGRAAAVARTAVADGASLILGPLFASSARAVSAVAEPRGLNVISFSTDASAAGGAVYLSGFAPDMEARQIIRFAASQGYRSLAVLYPQTDYGAAALRGAREAAGQGAMQLVHLQAYARSPEGISSAAPEFAASVRRTGADAVLIAERGRGLTLLADGLGRNGLGAGAVKHLGLGQWNSRVTFDAEALRGGWFPAPDPAALRTCATAYKDAYGDNPPALALLGYDAVEIAGQMLETARRRGDATPFDRDAITRVGGFGGIVGPIRFRRDGIGERGMAILEVGEFTFPTVRPAPGRFGAGS